jgi:DNA-binding transcriptional ArsR family regulator
VKGRASEERADRLVREQREEEEVLLAKALGHPRRVAILECLNANGPMAPVEVSHRLGAELSNLSYHFRVLAKGGLIEEVARERIRGSVKTTYRATARPLFNEASWSNLSPATKAGISATTLQVLATRAAEALRVGTFDSKDSRYLTISTIAVDQEAWDEVIGMLASIFNRLDEIEAESRKRGGRQVPMSIGLLGFESPRMYE